MILENCSITVEFINSKTVHAFKKYYTYNRDYFEGNLDTAIQMHMQHPEEVTVKPIYDTIKIKGVSGINLLSTDDVA